MESVCYAADVRYSDSVTLEPAEFICTKYYEGGESSNFRIECGTSDPDQLCYRKECVPEELGDNRTNETNMTTNDTNVTFPTTTTSTTTSTATTVAATPYPTPTPQITIVPTHAPTPSPTL